MGQPGTLKSWNQMLKVIAGHCNKCCGGGTNPSEAATLIDSV
jgi:hypothetical protein